MASLLEEIADALARDVLRAVEESGDENLVTEVSRVIGSSSTTTQEAFMTAVRVRMSEQRARRLLADRLSADWPLQSGATGSAGLPPMTVLAQAAALAAVPTAAPRTVRIGSVAETRATVAEAPARPSLAEPLDATPVVVAEPQSPLAPEPDAVAAEEPLPEAAAEPQDPLRVRPKIPAPPPQVKPAPGAPAPRSLEAALALATSLPRKVVAPVEPATPVVNPYADIEMPDGDWG